MKKFLILAAAALIISGGCGKTTSETTEAHFTDLGKPVSVSEDSEGFEAFFDSLKETELTESYSKTLDAQMNLTINSEPYNISTGSTTYREKNGDEYIADFDTSQVVNGEEIDTEYYYSDGYVYFSDANGKYKQANSWDSVRNTIEGYLLNLVDYTVSKTVVSEYKNGYKKVEFIFDLDKLIEAPDENLFEILKSTNTSYQQLHFNSASCEGYITPEGYVSNYKINYTGYVQTSSGNLDFDYTTEAEYFDINNTEVALPENLGEYTEIPNEQK